MNSVSVSPDTAELARLQFVALSARLTARTALKMLQEDSSEAERDPRNKALSRRVGRIQPMLEQAASGEERATAAFCEAFERAMRAGEDVSLYAASYGRLRAGASANDITYGALRASLQTRITAQRSEELVAA